MTKKRGTSRMTDLGEIAATRPELLAKFDDLLAEGATLEDVAATATVELSLHVHPLAVENYFHRQPELQARRVRRMIEKADKLRAAIGDPESADGRLAEATLFTGLMGLTQKATALDLEDVHSLRLRREKLELERTIQKMREKESRYRTERMKAQTAHDIAKADRAKYELRKMRGALRTLKRGDRLDADTINQIREIYGIVEQPYIGKNPEEQPAQV